MDKITLDAENTYLQRVVNEIEQQLESGLNAASNYKKEAIDMQKNMREEVKCAPTSLTDLDAAAQAWLYQTDISNKAQKYKFAYVKVNKLERMLQSPYFGRIDFVEEGEDFVEQIYIGISNLSKGNTLEIMVYDWRAPISSMFYDFEIGPCNYICPVGSIQGQMTLKRQYKIENQNITYMFDSSLKINDEMLQEMLAKNIDSKMRTIVTSIQREQNSVIRNIQSKVLIVQGAAGSGKTSIALHRAAYLLYKNRETMKSENILIFSPNHVFEDYISNVLPELGEENILRNTFADFFGSMLDTGYRIETMNEQMEYILTGNPNKTRLKNIKFKSSLSFLTIMKNYVQYLEDAGGVEFKNIIYNDTIIISSEELYELFKKDYRHIPFVKRMEKLCQRLFYLLEQHEEAYAKDVFESDSIQEEQLTNSERKIITARKVKAEFEPIRRDILQMTFFDVKKLYRNMLLNMGKFTQNLTGQELDDLNIIGRLSINLLEQNIIKYEDIAPIVFLKTTLDSISDVKYIKHIIIDEAQDYTAIQYEIIKKTFEHSKITILGDLNQSVNAYMNIENFETISQVFNRNDTLSISLTKSYRSTKEIANFCNKLLACQNNSEHLERHGSKPNIMKVNKSESYNAITNNIINLKSKGYKQIAVICKTASQCEELYKSINSVVEISLISNRNEVYRGGVVVIPSYLAKGLEFEAVLVNTIDKAEYSKEEDRRVLYTVCTRALHELYLYYNDEMSDFVKEIDSELYET